MLRESIRQFKINIFYEELFGLATDVILETICNHAIENHLGKVERVTMSAGTKDVRFLVETDIDYYLIAVSSDVLKLQGEERE